MTSTSRASGHETVEAAKAASKRPARKKSPAAHDPAKTAAVKDAARTSATDKKAAARRAAATTADRTDAVKKAAAGGAAEKATAKTAASRTAASRVAAVKKAAPVNAAHREQQKVAAKTAKAEAAEKDAAAKKAAATAKAADAAAKAAEKEDPLFESEKKDGSGIETAGALLAVAGTSASAGLTGATAPTPGAPAEATPTEEPPIDITRENPKARAAHVTGAAAAPAATATASIPAPATGGVPAIVVRGLVKHFGETHAVDGVDLTVPSGSFYGIVGPNGAGKTTTLSMIAGLLRPDSGSIIVGGIDQRADPVAAKRALGVLPDRLRTFDRLTGRQLLYYYGLLRGLDGKTIEKRAADLARAFDLTEALSRVVSDYSAGMTKKLMLAGAMIHSPRVLVLDEPFESVDPVSSGVILDILRAYVDHGGTVVLSSHGMDLVQRVCSRVAIIVGGEVLAEGTIDEVRAGKSLESRFVELSGGAAEVEGLEWLHTFSG